MLVMLKLIGYVESILTCRLCLFYLLISIRILFTGLNVTFLDVLKIEETLPIFF